MSKARAASPSSTSGKRGAGGRKPQYAQWLEDQGLIQLEGWAKEGLTIEQIAQNKVGVSTRTLHQWMSDHSQIAQAIKRGRTFCVLEVENALYKAAVGYEVAETTKEKITVKHDLGDEVTIKERTQTRHVPPNVAAAIFYLKNRARNHWRTDAALLEAQERGSAEGPPLIINYNYVRPQVELVPVEATTGEDGELTE